MASDMRCVHCKHKDPDPYSGESNAINEDTDTGRWKVETEDSMAAGLRAEGYWGF